MADLTVASDVDSFMAAANKAAMLAVLNITLGGAFTTSGSFTTTLTVTGNTNVTLPTSGTLAILGANTFTGAQIISANGAASTPAMLLSGSPFTGGTGTTTKPLALFETAGATSTGWSTSGTMIGVNAPSGFAGNLADWQVNGTSVASISATLGVVTGTIVGPANGLALGVNLGAGGAYMTLGQNLGSIGNVRTCLMDSHQYIWSDYQLFLANGRASAPDCGIKWGAVGVVKITDAAAGRGTLDAAGYQVGGVAGANFSGTATNLTIVNGLVTAAS